LDLQDALGLAASGALTVPVAATYPMDGIHDALAALRQRAVLGRQVLELA
jgi:D-arabinose 1-dehydrogenase-like Zn-dependent alcohol dehydrogenase